MPNSLASQIVYAIKSLREFQTFPMLEKKIEFPLSRSCRMALTVRRNYFLRLSYNRTNIILENRIMMQAHHGAFIIPHTIISMI